MSNRVDEDTIRNKINDKYPRFEYIGGYVGYTGYIYIQCKDCGHLFRYHAAILKSANNKNIWCGNCKSILNEKKRAETKAKKEIRQEEKKRHDEQKEISRQKALKEKEIVKICVQCGEQFTTTKTNVVCCSYECTKKRSNNHKERRLHKCEIVDHGITLNKLVKRDKGICHICGKKVDMTADSNSGRYGSVDHVKAIANGGNHTWDNIKLAHRNCNNIKRDSVIYETSTGQLTMAT